jgi:hypothetical protein
MPAQAWVTFIIGGLATIGVVITWQQKNRADRRSEWWRRTTWAFERTFSTDDNQARLAWMDHADSARWIYTGNQG